MMHLDLKDQGITSRPICGPSGRLGSFASLREIPDGEDK
jgi:hypothetical protein